jgi:hypothetical protein
MEKTILCTETKKKCMEFATLQHRVGMDDLIVMSLVSGHPWGMTFHISIVKKEFGIDADEKSPKQEENYKRSEESYGV